MSVWDHVSFSFFVVGKVVTREDLLFDIHL